MKLTRLSKITFLTLVFLLPLFFLPWGYEMYVVPKSILLKVGISISTILVLADSFKQKKFKLNLTKKQAYWVLALLVILSLSMLVAVRPQMSFFGEYGRQGGLWNILFYLLFFLLTLHFFKKKAERIQLLKTISWGGFLISIYAIIQKFGFDIFPEETVAIFEGRSFGTLGNPTMLGAYLLFPIWGEIALLSTNKETKYKGKNLFFVVIMIAALISTRNRASILALLGSGMLFFLHHFRHKKKLIISTIVAGLIALTVFIGVYGANTRSINSRLIIWESSLEIIQDNPIFGYGLESYPYLFEHHVNPEIFEYEDYYSTVDRPHNEILEVWIHLGILGLIFYLALIGACLKKFFTTKDPITYFVSLGLGALFISNMFSFSLVTQYSFFTIFLGVIFTNNRKKLSWQNNTFTKVLSSLLIALLLISTVISINIFRSNLLLRNGYENLSQDGITESIRALENAIELNPYYSKPFQFAFDYYLSFAGALDNEYFYQAAVKKSEVISRIQHDDMQAALNKIHLAVMVEDFKNAEEIFSWVYEEIGIHPLFFEEWADLYFEQGEYGKAALIYDQYLASLPDDWQVPILSEGEMTEEQRIFWKNHPNFKDILTQIVLTYTYVGDEEKLIMIEKVLK